MRMLICLLCYERHLGISLLFPAFAYSLKRWVLFFIFSFNTSFSHFTYEHTLFYNQKRQKCCYKEVHQNTLIVPRGQYYSLVQLLPGVCGQVWWSEFRWPPAGVTSVHPGAWGHPRNSASLICFLLFSLRSSHMCPPRMWAAHLAHCSFTPGSPRHLPDPIRRHTEVTQNK